MVSIESSGRSAVPRAAVRAAAEGAVLAAAGVAVVRLVWGDPALVAGAELGAAAAWAASSASVAWLLWARERSSTAFWWSFGGGMALRAAVLGGLAAWDWSRPRVPIEPLLLTYVFVLLATLLTLEYRHLRLVRNGLHKLS